MPEKSLEEITGSNLSKEPQRTNWPASILYYAALPFYMSGGAELLEKMTESQSDLQQAFIPAVFMAYVTGIFLLRGSVPKILNATKNFFYSGNHLI